MTCQYHILKDDHTYCALATEIAGVKNLCPVNDSQCQDCQAAPLQQINHITVAMALSHVRKYSPQSFNDVLQVYRPYLDHRKKAPKELGDIVESALSMIGITKERVERWFGPCNCKGRQKKLNELSRWAKRVVRGEADDPLAEFTKLETEMKKLRKTKKKNKRVNRPQPVKRPKFPQEIQKTQNMKKLILKASLSPGDILTMTAAVKSLHETYPNEYLTDAHTSARSIWQNNPDITELNKEDPDVQIIQMEYRQAIKRCNQVHVSFLSGYTEWLGMQLGRPLSLTVRKPCLYLSEDETVWIDQIKQYVTNGREIPFWIVNAGIKHDFTAKSWPVEYYQEVIDKTIGVIQWVQIGAKEHNHPTLKHVIDLRGETDNRQLIRLVWHAQGGLGPVTYLQHLCAAFDKPYICLVGGREPVTWVTYPLQHTLHTIGALPCCRSTACWKSRITPLGDSDIKDSDLCNWPVMGLERPSARCMTMIKPTEVLCILDRLI